LNINHFLTYFLHRAKSFFQTLNEFDRLCIVTERATPSELSPPE
jgi:hypothetical protein